MTIIAVGSWRGVGASTSALLLAAAVAERGEQSWFVEADSAGGVLASRSRDLAGTDGLGRVAFHTPQVRPEQALADASRPLGGVRVVTGPWDSFQAWSAVAAPRLRWIDGLRSLDGLVVVDIGSLRGGDVPAWTIVERCDVLVMVTSPEPAALTSTVAWLDAKGQSAPGVSGLSLDTACLLVVDAPTASTERFEPTVAGELGDRLVGWWPWEPKVVDHVLRGGSLDHRALRRTDLPAEASVTLDRLLTRGVR